MTTTEETPLRIIELRVDNFKRVRAVQIRPKGSTVIIGGRNAQGKSSTLDAIEALLSGAGALPEEPIRRGTRKAKIVADLGELVVERTCTSRGTELVVKAKGDPVPLRSPQAILDKLCAKVAFDPLQFAREDAKKQDAILKTLLGLDFSDIESERAELYAHRTEANKELTKLDALIDKAPHHPEAKALVDVAALSAQIEAHTNATSARDKQLAQIDRLSWAKLEREKRVTELEREIEQAKTAYYEACAVLGEAEGALPPVPASVDDAREKLKTAEATNAKVRANAEREKLEKDATAKANESEQLTEKIKDLDAKKAERLAAAKFPIAGLGFDESGPTFNGIPLAQASQAERLRVSVAIGAALNPRLKVMLVREASLLDDASMQMLAKLAEETGSQIWLERVGTGDPSAVVIEDGSVVDGGGDEEPANGAAAEA